jgi:hypothetical protein
MSILERLMRRQKPSVRRELPLHLPEKEFYRWLLTAPGLSEEDVRAAVVAYDEQMLEREMVRRGLR